VVDLSRSESLNTSFCAKKIKVPIGRRRCPGRYLTLKKAWHFGKFEAPRSSRRGRPFDPEKPPKSEVLSDWTKIPHTDHLRNQRSFGGFAPSECVGPLQAAASRCKKRLNFAKTPMPTAGALKAPQASRAHYLLAGISAPSMRLVGLSRYHLAG
jgi:hypothetical protein